MHDLFYPKDVFETLLSQKTSNPLHYTFIFMVYLFYR